MGDSLAVRRRQLRNNKRNPALDVTVGGRREFYLGESPKPKLSPVDMMAGMFDEMTNSRDVDTNPRNLNSRTNAVVKPVRSTAPTKPLVKSILNRTKKADFSPRTRTRVTFATFA